MNDKKKLRYQSALIRGGWTFLEALVGTIPVGFVITPAMIQYFNIGYIYVILAWIATAALTAFTAVVKSHAVGMPEVDMVEYHEDAKADLYDEDDVEPEEDNEDISEGD